LSVTCGRSVVSSGHSSFLHHKSWPQQYNRNIVETNVKHHKPGLEINFFHHKQNLASCKKNKLANIKYTPSLSTIILSGRTYFSQNVLLTPEKCPTNLRVNTLLSLTIWSDIVVGRESGYLKIFFTFLEVNMSNILWSMRTFFPVCRMFRYVNTLVYFYLAPYSRQER
jgi:hypothetical protein